MDNVVIASWHSTLEFGLRALEHFATKAQARARVAAWIDEYNRDRNHSSIRMRSRSTGLLRCLIPLAGTLVGWSGRAQHRRRRRPASDARVR